MMTARDTGSLRGELLCDEPMSSHTSWRVGGPADRCYRPADLEDLGLFLSGLAASEAVYWVGLGSNLLVRDGGIRGTVILPFGGLNRLELQSGNRVYAGAGMACARVARFATRHGLCGAEFLAGIPGTMGGALAMNAGAFGGETWSLVAGVDTLNRYGEQCSRLPAEYEIGYRSVSGPDNEWFTGVLLQLESGDAAVAQDNIRNLLDRRAATQPTRQPSCGSVFRNPQGDHAARLIEASGLKGMRIGNAQVAEKHANFIVNLGGATAGDIEALIDQVRKQVLEQQGVALQTEVRIIGEAS